MNKAIRIILGLMLLTSFITHTIDIDSSNFVIARMTLSDIFGLLAIFLCLIQVIKKPLIVYQIPKNYGLAIVLVGTFLVGVFTSLAPKSTIAETLIVGYLILLSITIFYAFGAAYIHQLFNWIIATTFILSIIGLYDVIAININLPTIFNTAQKEHGVSGFRYFGQAANYSFTMLTLLIPLKYADLSAGYSKFKMRILDITILCAGLFMISTGRVSIISSFMIAVCIFLVVVHEKRIWKHLAFCLSSVVLFIVLVYQFLPSLYQNIIHRIQLRIFEIDNNTYVGSLMIENFKNTFISFSDNVFFGSGLGGFLNNYSRFEIHGTYFKVIGETGLVGVFGYGLFISYFIYLIFKNKKSKVTNFFGYFIPFFIASLVSWGYNYHVRKKEFWILFAVVMILSYSKLSNTKLKND